MDLRRLRHGDWIAGLSGVALVVLLFLPWYGASGTSATATAWEAFAVNDAILLFVGLFGIGLAVAAATQRTSAVPTALATLTALLGIVATILVAVRLTWPPGDATTREWGAWFGLAACLGILLGAYRAMADERTPRTVLPNIEVATLSPPKPEGNGA